MGNIAAAGPHDWPSTMDDAFVEFLRGRGVTWAMYQASPLEWNRIYQDDKKSVPTPSGTVHTYQHHEIHITVYVLRILYMTDYTINMPK